MSRSRQNSGGLVRLGRGSEKLSQTHQIGTCSLGDERADGESQRAQIEGPGEGRTRLRPTEGPDGADDPNRRPGPRQGRHHDGEDCAQHGPIAMASPDRATARA